MLLFLVSTLFSRNDFVEGFFVIFTANAFGFWLEERLPRQPERLCRSVTCARVNCGFLAPFAGILAKETNFKLCRVVVEGPMIEKSYHLQTDIFFLASFSLSGGCTVYHGILDLNCGCSTVLLPSCA